MIVLLALHHILNGGFHCRLFKEEYTSYSMPVSDLLTFIVAAIVIVATYRQLIEATDLRVTGKTPVAQIGY